jgi:alkylation response protein AidB-like acyl-CoA dehydrogenase
MSGTSDVVQRIFGRLKVERRGRVADRAVQTFGGGGYMGDYGIERLYVTLACFAFTKEPRRSSRL